MALINRKSLASTLAAKGKVLRDTEATKIAAAESFAHAAEVAAGAAQVAATQATAVEQAQVILANADEQVQAILSGAGVTV